MPLLKPSDVAILIPAFNEEKTIRSIVEKSLVHSKKIIVVDDGSSDNTVPQLEGLPITLIQHKENKGKGVSLLTGFSAALEAGSVESIITLDADGQHDPEDIARLIKAASQRPEHFIIGARLRNQEFSPRHRLTANKAADFLISLAAKSWVRDTQSGYRLYPASLLRQLNLVAPKNKRFVFESKCIIEAVRLGYQVAMLPINAHYPKGARKSHYKWFSDSLEISFMLSKALLKQGIQIPRVYRKLREEGYNSIILEDE
jgi:glycosyltransferase involved in cell wall biosynthesis